MTQYQDWDSSQLRLDVDDEGDGSASLRTTLVTDAATVNVLLSIRIKPNDVPLLIAELQAIADRPHRSTP